MSNVWESEPDIDQFESSGLLCILQRNHIGVWCGHVGLPASHPLFGQRRDVLIVVPPACDSRVLDPQRIAVADFRGQPLPDTLTTGDPAPLSACIDVHGGLWSSGMIGHEHPDLWFFGFMCGHQTDYRPADPYVESVRPTMDQKTADMLFRTPEDYRPLAYAREETQALASQLAALQDITLAASGKPVTEQQ